MSDSIARKRKIVDDLVGPAGKAKVALGRNGFLRYKVSCRFCHDPRTGVAWTSVKYLSPKMDGVIYSSSVALARWANHLQDRHPEITDAAVLSAAFLEEPRAQERKRDAERRRLEREIRELAR